MKSSKKTLIITVIAIAVLLAGGVFVYNASMSRMTQRPSPETGETYEAPDFTVYDEDGAPVKFSDLSGSPAVLNFWASWCGPCRSEMADFNEVWKEKGDDVRFMMVNMTDGSRETFEDASAFVEEEGFSFPVYYDTDMDAASTYGASALPVTYFIDSEGMVAGQARGAISRDSLLEGIEMIEDTDR